MRARHLAAPFVLLYWQLGPIPQPATGPDGRVRWSVAGMASSGRWEDASFDCDGQLTGSEAVSYRDIGGRVDVELPTSGARFTAVVGSARQSRGTASTGTAFDYSIMTYGGMAAWEGQRIGLGIGIVRDPEGETVPLMYLRTGRRDVAHFRMEVSPLSETPMLAGVVRAGVGFKQGFAGLTFSPYYEKLGQAAIFGDINVPVARSVDLRLSGTVGPGIKQFQWGVGAGLRLHY